MELVVELSGPVAVAAVELVAWVAQVLRLALEVLVANPQYKEQQPKVTL